TAEAMRAEEELLERADLHVELGLPRPIRDFWSSPRKKIERTTGARVMRFDFHPTREGWRLSEVNADVPGGFLEASGFARLMAAHYPSWQPTPDPASALVDAVLDSASGHDTIALVHATAFVDDSEVMHYVGRQIQARGVKAVRVSPAHLRWNGDRVQFQCGFAHGSPDALVRFFPADWLPELGNRAVWTGYFAGSSTPVTNPASALLIQSKRFPLVWDALQTPMPTWRELLPETISPSRLNGNPTREWILKPALGRSGEDVLMEGVTPEPQQQRVRKHARQYPRHWIAQRRFQSVPATIGKKDFHVCIGVFTVNGRASGAYGRVAERPLIDECARDAAVLVPAEVAKQ
ncbi:MAG: glutathionylspermidine synthase family protein, partial [Terriglobales bacterium]